MYCLDSTVLDRLVGRIVLFGGLAVSTGCATLVNGSSQTIPVTSDPPGARVFVDGALKGTTPFSLVLPRDSTNHVVRIEKTGYLSADIDLKSQASALPWWDLALCFTGVGAVPGIIGFLIDAGNAGWYFTPERIDEPLGLIGSNPVARRRSPTTTTTLTTTTLTTATTTTTTTTMGRPEPEPLPSGYTMEELRTLYEKGFITTEEYEKRLESSRGNH